MATPLKTNKSELGNTLDLVDIKEIRNNAVIMKDGSMKQVVMVGGVNFALKSEREQTMIIQGYQNFLNSVDFPLQIIVHSRKVNIDTYVQNLTKRKDEEKSPLLKNQIDEYVEFIKGFVQKNAIMEKTFLVVVPFYPGVIGATAKSLSDPLSLFKRKKSDAAKKIADAAAEKNVEEDIAQLSQRTGQVMSGLVNTGLEVTILENDALIELYYNFYNPQTVERENITLPDAKQS